MPGSLHPTVLTSSRVTTTSGLVCLAGACWVLIDGGPALIAAALLLGARASLEPRAQPWIAAAAPVWAGLVIAGAWRAGSGDLGDIRGAHTVLGIGIGHGGALDVASLWLVVLAGAAIAGAPRTRTAWAAWGVQAVLVTALVAGPSVRSVGDALPWLFVFVVVSAAFVAERSLTPSARLLVARIAATGAVLLGAFA